MMINITKINMTYKSNHLKKKTRMLSLNFYSDFKLAFSPRVHEHLKLTSKLIFISQNIHLNTFAVTSG